MVLLKDNLNVSFGIHKRMTVESVNVLSFGRKVWRLRKKDNSLGKVLGEKVGWIGEEISGNTNYNLRET